MNQKESRQKKLLSTNEELKDNLSSLYLTDIKVPNEISTKDFSHTVAQHLIR